MSSASHSSDNPLYFTEWSRENITHLYERESDTTSLVPLPEYGFVVVLIPAHNEEARIVSTLRSLREQTRHVDAIIVVADNCTDHTVAVALAEGVTVISTEHNTQRKAGALNQALDAILPKLHEDDIVLLMDADTRLGENFVASVTQTLWGDHRSRAIGGVGGVFMGDIDGWSLVQQLQQNEYVRYARKLARRRGRALVLTGTGSIIQVGVLRNVMTARRDGMVPDLGNTNGVYDVDSLTEDNELTLTIKAKAMGMRTVSPKDCQVFTALMPNYAFLYQQRRRWQRGALENLMAHGMHFYTAPYVAKQIASYVAIMFLPLYVTTLTLQIVYGGDHGLFPIFWVAVAVLYLLEQTWSVRKGGWRAVFISLALVPEILYSLFLDVVFLMSLFGMIVSQHESWGRGIDEESAGHTGSSATLLLSGGHERTAHWLARAVATLGLLMTFAIPIVPFFNRKLAWTAIAVFVIIGSINTVIRLIPVPTR